MRVSNAAKIVPRQFIDDFETVATHYNLRELGQYEEAKQSARNDLESAIVTFAAMAGDVHNAPGKPTVANERKKE